MSDNLTSQKRNTDKLGLQHLKQKDYPISMTNEMGETKWDR